MNTDINEYHSGLTNTLTQYSVTTEMQSLNTACGTTIEHPRAIQRD